MKLTDFLQKYGAFWLFTTIIATLIVKTFAILEMLQTLRNGTLLYVAIALMLIITLIVPLFFSKIPSKLLICAIIGYFIAALIDWNVHLWAAVLFLLINGFILYPLAVTIMIDFKTSFQLIQNQNHNSEASIASARSKKLSIFEIHYIRLLGVAVGTLFSRVLYFDFILTSGILSAVIYGSGIAMCIFYLIDSESELLLKRSLGELRSTFYDLISLLFFSIYLLLQSSYMLKVQNMFSFLPYHYYILIQLALLLVIIGIHTKYSLITLFCPILFVILSVLNFLVQNTGDIEAFVRLLFEISLLNMLFIFPNLPPINNEQKDNKSVKSMFPKWVIWFLFSIILFAGYFVFPFSEPVYQNTVLLVFGILLLIIWIKPRFSGNLQYLNRNMEENSLQNIKKE